MAKRITVREKIQPYIEQGLSAMEISKLTGYPYSSVHYAMNPVMYGVKIKKTEEKKAEKKKADESTGGWNKDRKACKKCQYRGVAPGCVHSIRPSHKNGCDYIEIVGHSRRCKPEECDKYVKGARININHKGVCNEGMGNVDGKS